MAKQQPSIHKIPFDEQKFSAMVEPLTIRVERIKGNARMPIPLPESDDPTLPAGTGWTKDLTRTLETWMVTEWAGGGLYEFSATDSSAQPITMKWSSFYDPREYPEKVPPPLQDATRAALNTAQQPIAPMFQPQPQVPRMSAFPNGLPSGLPYAQPYQQQPYAPNPYGQQYAPQQPYGPQYQMPQPPPVGTYAYAQWRDEAADRRRDDELKLMREREMQREREALEAKHKAEIERERMAASQATTRQDNAINELRTMIAQLAQTITQQAAQTKPNSELEDVRRKLEEQTREREAERRDAAMREQLRAMQENTQRQIEMMQRQMEQQAALAREAATNRPDQLVTMIQEQSRINAEALKEIARQNTDSIKGLQGFMLTPTAMFDLAARQTQGVDSMADKLARTYDGVLGLQTKVMENALALQPGGTTAVDVVRDGVNGLKEMVERYTGMKSQEQRLAVNAQVEIARAQAAAVAAQAQAVSGLGQPPNVVHTPPPPRVEQQLPPASEQPNNVTPITAARGQVERFGRFDKEWFGPLMPEVNKLRLGVTRFHDSLMQNPVRLDKDGNPDGVSPEQCAQAVMTAVGQVQSMGITVDALVELLFTDRWKDFFYVLLPDASEEYRDDAMSICIGYAARLNGLTDEEAEQMKEQAVAQGDGESHDDDGGDDGADDADDSVVVGKTNGAAVPQPIVAASAPRAAAQKPKRA